MTRRRVSDSSWCWLVPLLVLAGTGGSHGPVQAYPTAESFRLPLDSYPLGDGCLGWGGIGFDVCDEPGRHVADDACAAAGTAVKAVANGRVKFARAWKTCPNWGYVIVIEHTLVDGSVVCSIYGHCRPAAGVEPGDDVTKGQTVGTIEHYSCWPDHIHFGIYDAPYVACQDGNPFCWLHGYLGNAVSCPGYPEWPGGYLNPVAFVQAHESCELPQIPTLLSPPEGTSCQPGTLVLDWAALSGATGYDVQLGGSCGSGAVTSVTSSSSTQSGLSAGSTYTWRVRARNGCGNGSWSTCRSFTTAPAGANLSFDTANGAGTAPCGWTSVALGGASFSYPAGGSPGGGSRYVAFSHADAGDWNALGRPWADLDLTPGTYRLTCWYRSDRLDTAFSWRLGSADLTGGSTPLTGLIMPARIGEWRQYASAPLAVTSQLLSAYPMLGLYVDYGALGTLEIDAVQLVPAAACGVPLAACGP